MTSGSRIAIIHERWTEIGGAESVIEELLREWPDAPVYVPFADPAVVPAELADRFRATRLDRLYRAYRAGGLRSHAPMMPLAPAALRGVGVGDVDAVVISHYALAAAAAPTVGVPTVGYVHSPARWAWDSTLRAGEANSPAGRLALALLAKQARAVERAAAPSFTRIVANSSVVARRIEQWWGREAEVVHPPVDVTRFSTGPAGEREDYFLMAGRLVPYKRADLAVRAARAAGVRLIVAGEGRWEQRCREFAGPETTFVGRVDDARMVQLMQRARAVLMPGVEDFGIVPVEAMACGTPVIALGEGGVLDSVIDGVTGVLVAPSDDDGVVAGFAAAMSGFRDESFDPQVIRARAESFCPRRFRQQMRTVVESL
ncbi:Glycosyl transferase group 1 OS=Tsukamurella paurometabola (strain ATCC 8368 / DSM / CCUG 35730/ CIP 100753 / JCM 10117 / KCTC 9821 / NBRC 16120 / NCIMB 702349 / NCTC 13040) OX=521096 GN=Tpau_1577 PE=4 SV=1 [Tsukamurella paurometabola]|uniref:Glycosyl transferase group 1 n=1 Tax=Tsukamurella paurometabola (strain ATCC 8368 / DSM 20162 / CCUG 35730 / CIP 100753 / JCM 10117 / KCTC 9821 / NBRC 16120 / NCIMB 702349 / NCTC 13040) TaxID=521096 RepID=D5UY91_TSUPD|nr:glycosyltransferase [Tsukamurella paurometabola]ADG78198.1 glycosyl transferase group 1 [Tsukamurella paurometabola DSM 20162]SUP30635.1 Glycogen synthase [Tsukamurella paurometabola]